MGKQLHSDDSHAFLNLSTAVLLHMATLHEKTFWKIKATLGNSLSVPWNMSTPISLDRLLLERNLSLSLLKYVF